jgi:gliding motility-associated-like protein
MTGATNGGWVKVTLQTPFFYSNTQNFYVEVSQQGYISGFTTPQQSANGIRRMWGTVASPTATNSGTGLADFGFDLLTTPCSGQPVAGTAVTHLGCPANISLAGSTAGTVTGINVQWQKRAKCTNAWLDIPGANNVSFPLSTPPNSTDYRAYIVCTNSNLADTSTIVNVTSISPCYCTPSMSSSTNDDIFNVTVGSFSNSSVCASVATGPGTIVNRYSNYTTLPPIKLPKNSVNPFSLQSGNCGSTNLTYGVAVFIDLDRNGTYDPGENVFSTPNAVASPVNVSGNITIPPSATSGITGMRVVMASGTPGSSLSACGTYTDGEIEDYLVDIQYAPIATGGGVHCSGADVTLTMSAPGFPNPQLIWKLPNGSFSTSTTINLNNIQTSASGNYTAYLLTNSCPGFPPDTSGGRTISVLVNQSPPKPIVSPIITYCLGEQFDSIAVFGQNLRWYSVPTGGIPLLTPPVINTNVPGSATYYVAQVMNNCESPRAIVTVNVVPKPGPPQVKTPVGYCQGDVAVPLSALGQNIRWYSVPTGGVGTPMTPTPTTNAQGSFTWYATQTVAGCESVRVPVEVTVSYIPNALILTSKEYVCQYDTMTLKYFGNAHPEADYIWTLPVGASKEDGFGQGPLVVRFDTAGIHTVRLSVDNKGCVGPEATVDVTVRLAPRFTLDLQEDACQGDIVNIAVNNSTIGIDTFKWNGFAGGEVVYGSPTAGPYGIRWNTPGVKILDVQAIDEVCKSLPFTDTVDVHELPNAKIIANKENICTGDTVAFRGVYEFGNSYRWEPRQFFGASHTDIDSGIIDHSGYVTLYVTNRFNCTASDSVLISAKPCCEINFPNAFTPNNDGRNDRFRAITVGTHQITAFQVQNRWGQVVFNSGDELTGWDGTFNGKPQDMGTYFYYIKYKCSDGNFYEDKGEVVLVR